MLWPRLVAASVASPGGRSAVGGPPARPWLADVGRAFPLQVASIETAIPETNVGYQLLCKLGWRGGGLGRQQQGGQVLPGQGCWDSPVVGP